MRRLALLAIVFLFGAPGLFAQRTIVSGTVKDANGVPYAGGTLVVTLSLPLGVSGATLNGVQIGGSTQRVTLDTTGSFLMQLPDNAVVLPGGTQWAFNVNISPGAPPPLGTGPQNCAATLTITGASQSVSSSFASCPNLGLASGLVTNVTVNPGTCSVGQVFFNTTTNQLLVCTTTNVLTVVGGTGSVTSFSYSETGIDPLMASSVTAPTTTPNLNQVANTVQPGMVLAGPVPTGTSTNPTFENAGVNASTVNGTTVSVSGAPAAATSAAIMFGTTATGQNVPVPDGTWTAFSGVAINGSHPLFKNLSSNAKITPTSTIGASDSWSSSLAFLGGSISAISQSTPSFSTACGVGCATTTFSGAVTAGHAIVVYGYWASGTAVPTNISASDTVGNTYVLMLIAPNLGQNGHFALVAQNVGAGTPTVTVRSVLSTNIGGLVAYELAGPTAYYTGPTGPWQFRFLDPATLAASGIATGIAKYFTQNLGADITGIVNNSTTTLLTQVVTFPSFGCPCRVSVSYGAAVQSNNSHLFETWISDGVNTGGAASQEYVNTGIVYSSTATPIFPNNATATYSNNQSITFTLNLGITTLAAGTVTAKQLSPGGHQATWMQISILPTLN
jgi:hypothetical protein